MKRICKRIASALLACAAALSLMPAAVWAVPVEGSLDLTDGVTRSGDGWAWNAETMTLTLNGADIRGSADCSYAVQLPDGARIQLAEGTQNLITAGEFRSGMSAAVVGNGVLVIEGAGSLTATGGAAQSISAGIAVQHALTVQHGAGVTAVGGESDEASFGVYTEGSLSVTGCAGFTARAAAAVTSTGAAVQGAVMVTDSPDFTAEAADAGMASAGLLAGSLTIINSPRFTAKAGSVQADAGSQALGIAAMGDVRLDASSSLTAGAGNAGTSCGLHAAGGNLVAAGPVELSGMTSAVLFTEGSGVPAGTMQLYENARISAGANADGQAAQEVDADTLLQNLTQYKYIKISDDGQPLPTLTIAPANAVLYADGGQELFPSMLFRVTPDVGETAWLEFPAGQTWAIERVGEDALGALYRVVISLADSSAPVSLTYEDAAGAAVEDRISVPSGDWSALSYSVALTDLEQPRAASMDGKAVSVNGGAGTLTLLAVEKEWESALTEIASELTKPDAGCAAAAPAQEGELSFTLKGTTVPAEAVHVNASGIRLLFDTAADVQAALKAAIEKKDGADPNRELECRYIDLVDEWTGTPVEPDAPVRVCWAYPEGTDSNTSFRLLHFAGAGRGGLTADASYAEVPVERTADGVCFETETFSPFVLVWNEGTNEPQKPVEEEKPDAGQSAAPAVPNVPQTGDEGHPALYIGMLAASAVALVAIVIVVIRRRR